MARTLGRVNTIVSDKDQPELRREYDALTGLLSQNAFRRQFEAERAAMREGTRHVLIFVDLEGVFGINRSHGYLAGDGVLRHIANHVRNVAGDDGLAGRLGGCRFLILKLGMPRDRGIEVANELWCQRRSNSDPLCGRVAEVKLTHLGP